MDSTHAPLCSQAPKLLLEAGRDLCLLSDDADLSEKALEHLIKIDQQLARLAELSRKAGAEIRVVDQDAGRRLGAGDVAAVFADLVRAEHERVAAAAWAPAAEWHHTLAQNYNGAQPLPFVDLAAAAAPAAPGRALRDGDIEVSQAKRAIVCPITKAPMRVPVRARTCGHTFERDAIMALLKAGAVKCPAGYCTQRLHVADLADDPAFGAEIRRRLKEESAQLHSMAAADL